MNIDMNIIYPLKDIIITRNDLIKSLDEKGFDPSSQNKDRFNPSKTRCKNCKSCVKYYTGKLKCELAKEYTEEILYCNFNDKLFKDVLYTTDELIEVKIPSPQMPISISAYENHIRDIVMGSIIDYYIKMMKAGDM